MELKVWCDGIQRVICGVTEKTTCQDVVIALAQAMGKTGRYTLVEKWRENERFVSPDERPLAALSKWGEYAGDVQFILRHSGKRSNVNGRRGSARSSGDSWAGKLYGFSPHSSSEPHIPSSTSLRKSLTFSGAHSRSHLLSNHVVSPSERGTDADAPTVNGSASSPERRASPADGGVHSGSTRIAAVQSNAAGSGKPQYRPHSASSRSAPSSRGDSSDQRATQHDNVPFGHAAGTGIGGSLERTRKRQQADHLHQSSDASVSIAGTSVAGTRTCLGNAFSSVAGTGLPASSTRTSVASARTPVASVVTSVTGTKTSVGSTVSSVPTTRTSAESHFASLANTLTSVSNTSTSVVNSRTSAGKPYTSVANSKTSGSSTATSVTNTVTSLHNKQTSDAASKAFSRLFPRREAQQTSPVREKSTSFPRDIKPVPRESNNNIDFKPNANLTNLSPSVIKDGSPIKDSSISCDNDREEQKKKSDLLRLVNAQLEQIQKHEDDIRRLETDISLIEHFDHEPVENAKTKEEIARLKKLDYDLDSEIQELELVSWEGKLELELEKEKRLKAEMETVKKNLNNCKAEIEKLNTKIKELSDEITKQKELRSAEEKQAKEQERKVSAELADLQKQIRMKVAEYEEQEKTISELQAEAKKLEAEIQEKKAKIAELEKELKETNMMSFIRAPTGLLRGSLEGHTFFNRASPSRPGSARKLDSAQGLKECLSAAKSPHGLWV